MKKIIVVHAFSGQHPHCSTLVRLSRIIERPPTRVFHSCLLPSTLFNGSAASYTSSRIWMPPLHQVDLVTFCGKSAVRAPFADGFLNQLLVTFIKCLFSSLLSVVQRFVPSIQILISNGLQTRALSKSFASVSLTHHCSFGLTIPEYSQTTAAHA